MLEQQGKAIDIVDFVLEEDVSDRAIDDAFAALVLELLVRRVEAGKRVVCLGLVRRPT